MSCFLLVNPRKTRLSLINFVLLKNSSYFFSYLFFVVQFFGFGDAISLKIRFFAIGAGMQSKRLIFWSGRSS